MVALTFEGFNCRELLLLRDEKVNINGGAQCGLGIVALSRVCAFVNKVGNACLIQYLPYCAEITALRKIEPGSV